MVGAFTVKIRIINDSVRVKSSCSLFEFTKVKAILAHG